MTVENKVDAPNSVTELNSVRGRSPRQAARAAAAAAEAAKAAQSPVREVPPPEPELPSAPPPARADTLPDVHKAIRAARRSKRRLIATSFSLMVALPTLITALYYAFFAADQFAAEARFAIRGSEQFSTDILGMLAGTGSGVSVGDSYILADYIKSREIVDRLEPKLNLKAVYATETADWLARFPSDDPIEDFVEYWRKMVTVEFDSYTGIVVLKVKAFDPQHAVNIASAIVDESRMLVNRLSEQSRLDTVALAQREVQFAEERLREARSQLAQFQDRESTLSPMAIAEAHERLIAELEAQLSRTESELGEIRNLVGPDAPSRRILEGRIGAIKAQIAEQRQRVSTGDGSAGNNAAGSKEGGISGQLTAFQGLETEVEFSQKAYVSSLAALEAARIEAKRDQRYLATFVTPSVPETAEFPRRYVNTLLIFLGCAIAWGIAGLLYAAVRDHVV